MFLKYCFGSVICKIHGQDRLKGVKRAADLTITAASIQGPPLYDGKQ